MSVPAAMADVPIRDAATVVLLRDSTDGIEVWLLTRVRQMVFAAGMAVFPGGRVDAADADLPFAGAVDATASRFGCAPEQARALLGAAVRETFEETGVLLTVPAADLSAARSDVEAGTVSFGDLLRSNGLSIDVGTLYPWARWVTPAGEVRRYDTRFFLAVLPAGAEAHDATTESSSAGWFSVGAAIEAVQRGDVGMLPPTISTVTALSRFSSVAEATAAAAVQSLDPISPVFSRSADGTYTAELPDGSRFAVPASLFGGR